MKKQFNWRHGDICGIQIKSLPTGLQEATTDILIGADETSGGNEHTFKGGKIYPNKVNDFIIGYLEADNTTLYHDKHGEGKGELKEAKIEDGFYEIRRQNEDRHEGLRSVVD